MQNAPRPQRRYRSPRTNKGRPRITLEFVRDDDGSSLGFDVAKNLASIGQCPPLRELRFLANDTLLWSLDVNNVEAAYGQLRTDMAQQATGRGVASFVAMVSKIQSALHWSENESLALAIVFTFPDYLAFDRIHVAWDGPRARGRPMRVDSRTKQVWMWAHAWQALTGTWPGIAPNALFAAAVAAAGPFMRHARIGLCTPIGISRVLQRERNKLRSAHFRWVPPTDSDAGFRHTI